MKLILIALFLVGCITQADWEENTKAKIIFENKFQIKSELSSCNRPYGSGSYAVETCIGITVNNVVCQYTCTAAHCVLETENNNGTQIKKDDGL